MPSLNGFGPLSQSINTLNERASRSVGSIEDTSNVAYQTSNIAYQTSNVAYNTSNFLFPRDDTTVSYMNEIVTIATNATSESEFLTNLYNAFNGRSQIQ